ncbi:MAG: hypothetical protein M1830_002237, partial [Pleopsidium flavum]
SVLQNQEEASSKARNQNGLQILNSDGAPDSEEVNIVDYQSPVAAEGRLSDPVNHHFEDAVLAMQDDGSEIPEDKAFKEPVVAVVVAPDTQDYPRDNEGQSMALKIKGALAPLASPPGQNDAVRKPSSILKKRQGVKKDVPIASNIRINRKDTAHTQVVAKRPIGPPPQPPIGHVALPSESNMGNRATRHIHQSPSRIKAIESVHMVRQKNESKENSHSQQSVVISVSSKGSEKDTYYTDEDDEEIEQLNTPRPKNKSKRKADNIDVRHGAKRAKTNATSNTRATTAVGHRKASPDRRELFTQVLVDDYLHRKAPIISFSAKGPRNQGVILAKKPGRGPHDDTAEGNPETGRHLSIKRKHDHDTDKRAKAAANTSAVKRLKLGRPIPHTGDSALETAPKSGSPPIAKPFQKQGSQGKKVAENGSPIAISYNPDLGNGPYERLHDLFVNGDGHSHHYASLNFGDDEVDDDVLLPNDDLPLLKSEEPPETDPEGMILSSNRKPPPDSPSAPSKTLAAFSAHRVQSGGKFVNVKTAKVVKAAEPPDPFISVEPARTSSFMDKLRARNYPNHKEDFPNSKDVPRLPRVQPQENDPDKTLVNDPAEDDEVFSPSIILASATSMSSGSTNTTHHTNESRAESEPDPEKEWRDALKPHQRNMLDILYQISNRLVRHLVDKETATEDIVHDYQRGGTRLIEELERAHQAEYARFQRDINTAKTELKAEYKTTMEQIIEGNREIRQRPVAALRMEHMDKQQHLNELLEAAYRALD